MSKSPEDGNSSEMRLISEILYRMFKVGTVRWPLNTHCFLLDVTLNSFRATFLLWINRLLFLILMSSSSGMPQYFINSLCLLPTQNIFWRRKSFEKIRIICWKNFVVSTDAFSIILSYILRKSAEHFITVKVFMTTISSVRISWKSRSWNRLPENSKKKHEINRVYTAGRHSVGSTVGTI